MKRYKVVQDANGHWGVLDTVDGDFASWTDYFGYEWLDVISYWAIKLNRGHAKRENLYWTAYNPRKENR